MTAATFTALVMLALAAEPEAPAAAPKSDSTRPPVEEPQAVPTVVVTGTRAPRPVRDVPATVVVLPRAEIDRSPSLLTDDLLRTVPSVATFRRSSSLVADPTSQGLNLRGVGPSGVSRALVLLDGVPVNDPFGGWVYWRALPRLGLERVEIVPGGGSASYGTYALGGVVQLFSRPITGSSIEGDLLAGYPGLIVLGGRATERFGAMGAELEGEWLASNGYPPVPEAQRGAIDGPAPSSHGTFNGRVEVALTDRLSLTARAGYFDERQNGGTTFTTAAVGLVSYSAGLRWLAEDAGTFDLSLFGHVQRFRQQRARIAPDRSSETLAAEQDVPTDDEGASLVWTSHPATLLGTHVLIAGADARRIAGTSHEQLVPPAPAPAALVGRDAGGQQQFGGVFLQDLYSVTPAIQLLGALRLDLWRNLAAGRTLTRADGTVETTAFDERRNAQLNPRLGVLYRPLKWLALRASGYRAFRAPTLNELYRPFQVGTVLTAANENLDAETLLGAEAGVEVTSGPLTARATGFWNELDQPITNVTLAAPLPDGSRRQRQNLGRARIRGVEVGFDWRFARRWSAVLAYTLADSAVTEAPGNPDLIGKRLPQDPVHRATALLTFQDPALFTATAQARWVGPQFEDDLNQLPLSGALIVDISASRKLFWNLEVFAAIENLFNQRYLVGRAGVDTLGPPFTVLGGLRLR